jgi:hypothetical protein
MDGNVRDFIARHRLLHMPNAFSASLKTLDGAGRSGAQCGNGYCYSEAPADNDNFVSNSDNFV